MPKKIEHSVDGIEEYDNPIPKWLMWLLYATITIAVVYLIMYPGFWKGLTGWNQHKMYAEEMAAAEIKYGAMKNAPVDIAGLIGNSDAIGKGQAIYTQNCAACHGADAKGFIGPNLTDNEWLYGGKPQEIVNTITNGTEKGMPNWGPSLGSKKIANVAAYVHSLGGGQ
ncbi:Cytochrome c oxidase (cbb3-type) subunit CcoP [hydrothermal vent metagenome]|uniref:Cytochrome c oxidase (Cbb3-type) subunit CcoP n=1 Tax=hydrothermal vent metagenome TaxID=652676 RepID=A0A3B0QQN7_9ZZZZ